MSGANTIAVATALLETGMIPMQEPITEFSLDAAAGLVAVTAECEGGRCKSVAFHNVPAFVFGLNVSVPVPGLGDVKVDIAWGGMIHVLVDAASVGLRIKSSQGAILVDYDAVCPTVKGSAWITAHKQVILDPTDPFPEGFRVGDVWQMGGVGDGPDASMVKGTEGQV